MDTQNLSVGTAKTNGGILRWNAQLDCDAAALISPCPLNSLNHRPESPGYLDFSRCSIACITSTLPFSPVWQKFISFPKISSDCCVSMVVLPIFP